VNGAKINGRYFRQEYKLQGGSAAGQYENGNVAVVQNKFGQGKTLLMGSFPGAGYYLHHAPAARTLFASFLEMAGTEPQLKTDDSSVQARLHRGRGGNYLWVTNPTLTDRPVTVTFGRDPLNFGSAEDLWGNQGAKVSSGSVAITVPARDAVVLALK
jgi:beta-galactosidase